MHHNQRLLEDLTINYELTPENAAATGYEYVSDVIYDREAPQEAMQDIIDLITIEQYLLGCPASTLGSDIFVGLYKPLKQ